MYLPRVKTHPWLLPLAWLYGAGVRLRNYAFRRGWLRQETFDIPIICVGNIAVGGTGKTPHTEYLVRLLQSEGIGPVAVLSRGYKRKSKGFVLATPGITAQQLGDESYQLYSKFPGLIVAVDAHRRNGIKRLLELPQPPAVIILDDAFQHRYVRAGLNICLTSYARILYKDKLLPAGRLREPQKSIRRADLVVVTKCPAHLRDEERTSIEGNLPTTFEQPIFYSSFRYLRLINMASGQETDIDYSSRIILVTGIADPSVIEQYIQTRYRLIDKLTFDDHHHFTDKDLHAIRQRLDLINKDNRDEYSDSDQAVIITTEKDAARLHDHPALTPELKEKIFILPAEVYFIAGTELKFNKKIIDYVRKRTEYR